MTTPGPPSRRPTFAPPRITVERRPDGSVLLSSTAGIGPHDEHLARTLRHISERTPDVVLASSPDGPRRRELTYRQARAEADAAGQRLLELGAGPGAPVMLLSGNSLEHLVLTLACYTAGIPAVPVSVAYALSSTDHHQLRAMAGIVRPGVVFADDATAFGAALDTVVDTVVDTSGRRPTIVTVTGRRPGTHRFDEVTSAVPGAELERAYRSLSGDSVAKILFTSGSTGVPKGVVTTQRMLTSNQQMMREVWPFLLDEPPVLVDWLPWSHTFGGSHNVNMVLTNGGTLHIDVGRPTPDLFPYTVDALRAIAPTVYVNVPAGYAMLVPRLERDPGFARQFFSRLRVLFYAAAALPQNLWGRLERLVEQHAPRPVPFTSSWGTTETAPAATSAHWTGARCGCIGVPLPGVTLKLVPDSGKREIRIAGPNVTPGYLHRPDITAAAFDEDGFYRTGDAVVLVDDDDPNQGLMFDGRIAEDFKLATGTWVSVATVRGNLVSAAGVLADAVIAGHDRDEITALAWINQAEARVLCAADADVAPDDPTLRAHLRNVLAELATRTGSSGRVERLLLCAEPPDIDAGEITDKGYINQRVVLERRSVEVDELYSSRPGPRVIQREADEA